MKKTATIILNRNLPQETDRLYDHLYKYDRDLTDVYVVESGSDANNLSKNCTWWANWEESLEQGLRFPRGFNYGLSQLLKEGKYSNYDFFFLLFNDTELPSNSILDPLLDEMNKHKRVGILSPCSQEWGEKTLLTDEPTKYFWYVNHVAWLVRRTYIDEVREIDSPDYLNFLYDGTNFRGYESEIELTIKGYINDWASAITTRQWVRENKNHLFTKADLIKTEPYEESVLKCIDEGRKWMRKKYGFNSRWSMQQYAKFFYERYFDYFPELSKYRI